MEATMRIIDQGLVGIRNMAYAAAKQAMAEGNDNQLAKQVYTMAQLLLEHDIEEAKIPLIMAQYNIN